MSIKKHLYVYLVICLNFISCEEPIYKLLVVIYPEDGGFVNKYGGDY